MQDKRCRPCAAATCFVYGEEVGCRRETLQSAKNRPSAAGTEAVLSCVVEPGEATAAALVRQALGSGGRAVYEAVAVWRGRGHLLSQQNQSGQALVVIVRLLAVSPIRAFGGCTASHLAVPYPATRVASP